MNKEVHYEGWLIKSPPTKRIWRARWRRRWFTLKQGEIPEQFCLEYYTDRNCRKLKGVIDLDQCEQVDCGLRLENRKQKFQFMFDIKTPKRTYYLAADTEADMRDWVNCICQVCHLLDTKQSSEILQDTSRNANPSFSIPHTNVTSSANKTPNSTTSSSIDSSSNCSTSLLSSSSNQAASFNNSIQLRRQVVLEQPQFHSISSNNNSSRSNKNNNLNNNSNNNNSIDCPYVNTEYSNRETVLCDMRFDSKQLAAATSPLSSPGAAIYLNSPMFGAKQQQQQQQQQRNDAAPRLAVNANGVVRKIPENLVLSNISLSEFQQQQQQQHQQLPLSHSQPQTTPQQQQLHQHSVQPSPALSTASGPYIPISECFSGSPKFAVDGNNPTTPLNNLDPKFYDTPRCHNNIGLNLTNDQSYSPKITNCNLQMIASTAANKSRCHRSDSDSESVFTDDEEWARPLPLREIADRSTRPSDSSVENESFVLTYSQRFSKIPDVGSKEHQQQQLQLKSIDSKASATSNTSTASKDPIDHLPKVLKNKNNLMLDFMEKEKTQTDLPQLSDTENTSPAIGPRDARSVVEESYDIPRSHNLPYYNMGQLFEKTASPPEANPIAASTPNLMASNNLEASTPAIVTSVPAHVRTLPRPHCYTNAAPTKIEGNVFRYDFIEKDDLPPVNRKLKPKMNLEDKPPEEAPAKPPTTLPSSAAIYDNLASKLMGSVNVQSQFGHTTKEKMPFTPPSVDRKLKPNLYKTKGAPTTSPSTPSLRRSTGAPLSMVLPNDNESYVLETRTLPRQLRSNITNDNSSENAYFNSISSGALQPNPSSFAAVSKHLQKSPLQTSLHPTVKNEHKLQYFDLDVANPPQINRQSMSVGNLSSVPGVNRVGLTAANQSAARSTPPKSGVVYNFVDFVKTEAFKRIREERKKESEGNSSCGNAASGNVSSANNSTK